MQILEYNDVDPLQVLHLTMLALDFPFTPEYAIHIRRTDPRLFPWFTVNAVEHDIVLGQVGAFRLPMVSIKGREDVGGIWAACMHPHHAGHEVASALLEEAHVRMQAAGLRFSTLGTNRYHMAHRLYRRHGYVDMNVWATAMARWETAHQPTRLRVQPPNEGGFDFVEKLFKHLASDYLGFAWRHTPFARLRERVNLEEIWIVWEINEPVGYVFARSDDTMLNISIQILHPHTDAVEVVAAVASELKTSYVQVTMSRPADIARFQYAGWQVAHPTWGSFMIKPLFSNMTVDDARRLFGIGTDRFLISRLDTT